jgi:S-adenosylmethionine hydrolase
VIDISHTISKFNIQEAAYVLRNVFSNFPSGTIHIVSILSEEWKDSPHLIVKVENQYFIGSDSGLFSLAFGRDMEVYLLNKTLGSILHTFPTKDVFLKVAMHLKEGKSIDEIATKTDKWREKHWLLPISDDRSIIGHIQYVDSYENLILNISQEFFERIRRGREFTVYIRNFPIRRISTRYSDAPYGELLVLFNAFGFMEIAQNQGNAASLVGLGLNQSIRIEFS